MTAVLGIDPGTQKAGFAVVDRTGRALAIGVEPLATLGERVAGLVGAHHVDAIALGRGTHAGPVASILAGIGLPIHDVDERGTTLLARGLYFADHPPRGWRRFVPLGMQLPPRPIDDYAAILIARRYLAAVARPGVRASASNETS
ncbi:MAG: pre-16S rRNA-processing nuclease YqgF [Candidatus Eremiobacteraeota bacterium]|nr:pre-16S rRNA-processing nuclease YqgF [Candidatus Eremiobacteraeota bacterium]